MREIITSFDKEARSLAFETQECYSQERCRVISSRFVCVWNVHDDFLSWFVVVAFTRIFHFSNRGCASTSQCDVVQTFGPKIFIDCGGNEAPIIDETDGYTTKPECARPRARQHTSPSKRWEMRSRQHRGGLLRPRTGALRRRPSCGPSFKGRKGGLLVWE